jgi:hypothetical protein
VMVEFRDCSIASRIFLTAEGEFCLLIDSLHTSHPPHTATITYHHPRKCKRRFTTPEHAMYMH